MSITWILVACCWWLLSCGSGVVNSWILGCWCRLLSGCWSSCILVCCCGSWWLFKAAVSCWSWLSCGCGSNSWIREICCWLLLPPNTDATTSWLLWERLIRDTAGCDCCWPPFREVISGWWWLKVAAGMDSGCDGCQSSAVGWMGSDNGTPHS